MISTWVPGGNSPSTISGSSGTWCTCTWASASASTDKSLLRQLLGPGVDQVQFDVMAGQDPRQLQADVP